jgi:hypothetical protein
MLPSVKHSGQFFHIQPIELTKETRAKFAESIEKQSNNYILARHLDEFVFATARAVDVGDYYGKLGDPNWEHCVNANGDYFDYTEVTDLHPKKKIPVYKTFVNRGFYRNHQSDKVENAIGLVFDSVFNTIGKNSHIISCLIGVDKHKAPDVARTLTTYPQSQGVSMGCTIRYSICTNCGHSTENMTKCNCLQNYFNRRHPTTKRLVAEMVKGVDFFELSAVTNPAFAFSYVLDVIKEWVPGTILRVASESKNQELLNMLEVFSAIKRRLKTADYVDKLILSAKLDTIIMELRDYGVAL